MKNKYIKPVLVIGVAALLVLTMTARADDSSDSKQSSENAKQSEDSSAKSSDNSKQGDNNSEDKGGNTSSGEVSPVQSKADPYGMKLAGQVMQGGSDEASKNFEQNVLPSLNKFIKSALPEQKNNTKSVAFQIDPNKLVLATKTDVRAYFVSEGAGYHNSIGVDAVTPGNDPKNSYNEVTAASSKLIFPDASSTEGVVADGTGKYATRTASEPLLPGDFVNLGTFGKGTKLDFFLLSNGANQPWANVISADSSLNGDGFKQHVAAFNTRLFAVPQFNSPYIFLSFEDLWGGGDKDINDTIIALDIGAANVKTLLATPEPAMWLTLGSFLALGIWAKRRMDRTVPTVA
ncbi:MAG: DUF4114 domain-containing protein [Verrucomicrobiae bacterium]